MFQTFSLKGTKDGLELQVKEDADFSFLESEIITCFSVPKSDWMPITTVDIKKENISVLERAVLEHLIKKSSAGRIVPKKESSEVRGFSPITLIGNVRSGEFREIHTDLIIRGSVHNGAFVKSEGTVLVLENFYGTAILSETQKIYIGKECNGQIRFGENIYFPTLKEKNGVWVFTQNQKLCLEDNGGNQIYG